MTSQKNRKKHQQQNNNNTGPSGFSGLGIKDCTTICRRLDIQDLPIGMPLGSYVPKYNSDCFTGRKSFDIFYSTKCYLNVKCDHRIAQYEKHTENWEKNLVNFSDRHYPYPVLPNMAHLPTPEPHVSLPPP